MARESDRSQVWLEVMSRLSKSLYTLCDLSQSVSYDFRRKVFSQSVSDEFCLKPLIWTKHVNVSVGLCDVKLRKKGDKCALKDCLKFICICVCIDSANGIKGIVVLTSYLTCIAY